DRQVTFAHASRGSSTERSSQIEHMPGWQAPLAWRLGSSVSKLIEKVPRRWSSGRHGCPTRIFFAFGTLIAAAALWLFVRLAIRPSCPRAIPARCPLARVYPVVVSFHKCPGQGWYSVAQRQPTPAIPHCWFSGLAHSPQPRPYWSGTE